jgi:DNA-directed RNA polymerase II subunit RPB1
MKELLSVSKHPKTPQMVIYLTKEYMGNKDMAHKIASHIKYTTLGDTREKINVYYDPNPSAKGSFMDNDNVKPIPFQSKGSRSSCQSDISGLPWLMRIELNREKMLEKEVTLLEIKSKFCGWWEKRFNDTKVIKGEEKKVLNKINQLTILSNSDNDEQPVLHIRFNVKDGEKDKFNMGTIDNFIDLIIDKFKLKGLNSIIDIPAIQEERVLTINEDTGNEDKNTQHVIYATGVNLLDIRYFTGIDLNKTITNNIMDVYETFGIEIARAVLLKEIAGAYSNAGGEVNYQHVAVTVDQMTATGAINSIDRHGMNKSDSDPLARASFEKTVEQLLIASVYGETDYMRSVSSRIMAGSVIKGGTGFCEIEFDTELVEKSEYIEGVNYTKKFTELHESTLAKDVINKKDDDIFIPL